MPSIEYTTTVAASPEAVWQLMTDYERVPEWVVMVDEMIEPPSEIAVGQSYREHGGMGPFKAETRWEFTQVDPQRRLVATGQSGPMGLQLAQQLEPDGDGTRVTVRMDLSPKWYIALQTGVMWPLFMKRKTNAQMQETGANAEPILAEG